MDPYPRGVPNFPVLTTIEQLLISKVFVVMQVYRLKGTGAIAYKGHCLNIEMDLKEPSSWCTTLPWLPKELPVLLIKLRHHNQLDEIKDFKININNIHVWLVHLKQNHPAYHDVVCDYTRLLQMVENDTMFGIYSIVNEVLQLYMKTTKSQQVVKK